MSGPPHNPHGRQPPAGGNAAWNHLQVPNFYPARQPQHAHMSNEHSILHQPTWHTPTTEPLKTHSHIFSLEQMLSERQFQRHAPGVDLTLTRNGGQNGDLPPTPISLSVRDTNKINSLPASALDIQPLESLKPLSPALKAPSPGLDKKRSSKRVDSILERLTPSSVERAETATVDGGATDDGKVPPRSVIVTAASSHDENSNSSSIPASAAPRDDDVVSPYSNEDSLDSQKSRRKRKPCKTVRLTKEDPHNSHSNPPPPSTTTVNPSTTNTTNQPGEITKHPQIKEVSEIPQSTKQPIGVDDKVSLVSPEAETIDNIAAMVQEGLMVKPSEDKDEARPVSVSVIKTALPEGSDVHTTSSPPKTTNTQFVEVENKLEEMFAGIEDVDGAVAVTTQDQSNNAHHNQDVTSTSNDLVTGKSTKKAKRKQNKSGDLSVGNNKKAKSKKQSKNSSLVGNKSSKKKKIDVKDVYAYDSGSNASSSRSRGPFIQIKGPRDSPLSVSVVNTPTEDDHDRKPNKSKKFHDDSEYRTKVRSKGLHCSTLSNQYDAQTKDATWICAFCKRGPHATELTGPGNNSTCGLPAAGDLFGPYFVSTNSAEFERRLDDPFDKQFKSKKIAKALENGSAKMAASAKRKRKHSGDSGVNRRLSASFVSGGEDCFWGISPTGSGTFEVWAHEDCIVWSAGTYLVGPKIVGLEEAVWTSCNVTCVRCHLKGANICCVKRGCVNVVHVCCARAEGWLFDSDNFKTFCPEHRVP